MHPIQPNRGAWCLAKQTLQSMKYLLMLMMLVGGLVSCDRDEPEVSPVDGTYEGTFDRSNPSVKFVESNGSLVLRDGKFSGESSELKYPANGGGTYRLVGPDSVEFVNTTAWTTEFDFSLILSERYRFHRENDFLWLSRSLDTQSADTYRLEAP